MRLRIICAAAAAVLAAATLTACRTNVGVAATIDGQRVSESDVSSYLTSQAKPVPISNTATTPPRSFVLDVLILRPFFKKVLAASPVGAVSERRLAALHREALAGKTDKQVAAQIGVRGYSSSFNRLVVDLSILANARNRLAQGVDVAALEAKVNFPVSLNPRYGTWTKKTLFIRSNTSDGTPNFLDLQPTPASGS